MERPGQKIITPSAWGICCPGPSLGLYKTQKKILQDNPACLVAVNGAILLDAFKFDYWVMQDIEVFETIIKKADISRFYATRLWIPRRWLIDIPKDYDRLNSHFQVFYKEAFPAESIEAFNQIIPFGHYINWRESTIFPAIALAILSGARDIRLYGADMGGQGYFIEGLENYRTQHTDRRWTNERHWFDCLAKECGKQGIIITRDGT
ncbi:MAG: hypothetical protein PHC54_05325 [Candidatus Omnitrophica bacterium]|nr:hypothetical protein [Candidatus Omnitrophota bacterium]MDD5592679.1 hypothetical protein [Candidatus Omnitrophota bacterium]